VPMLVELDQRVAIRRRERGLCSDGVEQPRESIQDEVEVALGVFVAQPAERSAIDLELSSAAVGNVDPAVPLRSELLGELQESRVNVDGRLSDAELAKVIDDHARHDPVLVVRRNFHPWKAAFWR